jgi:hypothetical protein
MSMGVYAFKFLTALFKINNSHAAFSKKIVVV